jgi:hypothetical protein
VAAAGRLQGIGEPAETAGMSQLDHHQGADHRRPRHLHRQGLRPDLRAGEGVRADAHHLAAEDRLLRVRAEHDEQPGHSIAVQVGPRPLRAPGLPLRALRPQLLLPAVPVHPQLVQLAGILDQDIARQTDSEDTGRVRGEGAEDCITLGRNLDQVDGE